jgi:hypothetical protein
MKSGRSSITFIRRYIANCHVDLIQLSVANGRNSGGFDKIELFKPSSNFITLHEWRDNTPVECFRDCEYQVS